MLPKPLNLSPQSNESTDSGLPHKLRRQAKSHHLLSDDTASSHTHGSEGTATSPREKQSHPASEAEPLSKILVRCCGCGYFHDVPHTIYDRMTAELEEPLQGQDERSEQKEKHVRCPWCRHVLGVKCCAGYVALVQLKERLH